MPTLTARPRICGMQRVRTTQPGGLEHPHTNFVA